MPSAPTQRLVASVEFIVSCSVIISHYTVVSPLTVERPGWMTSALDLVIITGINIDTNRVVSGMVKSLEKPRS